VAPDSGEMVAIDVPVRLVEIRNQNGRFITAVSQGGSPGCATQQTYTFTRATSNSHFVALPFGTWKVLSGNSLGSTSTELRVNQHNGFAVTGNDRTSSNGRELTLEPRATKP